jgi:hypothetical protein
MQTGTGKNLLLSDPNAGFKWNYFTVSSAIKLESSDTPLGALTGESQLIPEDTKIQFTFSSGAGQAQSRLPWFMPPEYSTGSSSHSSGYKFQELEFFIDGKEVPCAVYNLVFINTQVQVRPGRFLGEGIYSPNNVISLSICLLSPFRVSSYEVTVFAALSGLVAQPS